MLKILRRLAFIGCMVSLLFSCGSGSTVTLPQQKVATVIFSATNAALASPVIGFQITAKMPVGATVRLKSGSTTDLDLAATRTKLQNGSVFMGGYDSVTREITLQVVSSTPYTWGTTGSVGAFVEIDVDCQPSLTKADFINLNPTFPGFKVSDGTAPGPTAQFTPSMDVTGL